VRATRSSNSGRTNRRRRCSADSNFPKADSQKTRNILRRRSRDFELYFRKLLEANSRERAGN